ncbi:[citrate (pro-3S)-lyase] ligase [Mycoplasma sp. P36-A1]|uniref:[citrate (pro-3S)-lyase] ligase n=1 Tax=Mycoplasma sp. P36-A1 TaxID=3252900 RepID=UPI003C2FAB98
MYVTNFNYKIKYNKDKLILFLKEANLSFDDNIDYCLVIKENNQIVACACKKENVFKMIAVSEKLQSQDVVSTLISGLIEKCYEENIYHFFIFTKMIYKMHFENIGFKLLTSYEEIGLFEMGNINFNNYYEKLNISSKDNNGAIVMNCNPFTLGHKYLIEQASKQVDNLIVFIVEEDKSYFKFKDRIELVKKGISNLKNVDVLASGPYIISSATFPTYFLKSFDSKAEYYTNIDIQLFEKIMNKLNIKYRFVGTEPTDNLTAYYNETMKKILKEKLIIIPRIEENGQVISASSVRNLLKEKKFNEIKKIVPITTYDFLVSNYL